MLIFMLTIKIFPKSRKTLQIFSFPYFLIIIPIPHGTKVIAKGLMIAIGSTTISVHSSTIKPESNFIIPGIAPTPTSVDTDVIRIDKFISPRNSRAE